MGHALRETLGVHRVGSGERFGARIGQAVVHVMRGEQAEAGVACSAWRK